MKAKTNVSKAKSRRGFTLVEMLVVIGMIAALAGISFPVYKSIQKKVERQQTEMDVQAIERAVDNFKLEYNYLPYLGAAYPTVDQTLRAENGDLTTLMTILAGKENTVNFKAITFLEMREAKPSGAGYKSGLNTNLDGTVTYYTELGTEIFRARLDHNEDDTYGHPYNGSVYETQKDLLFWDSGADGLWYTLNSSNDDDIRNFDGGF